MLWFGSEREWDRGDSASSVLLSLPLLALPPIADLPHGLFASASHDRRMNKRRERKNGDALHLLSIKYRKYLVDNIKQLYSLLATATEWTILAVPWHKVGIAALEFGGIDCLSQCAEALLCFWVCLEKFCLVLVVSIH